MFVLICGVFAVAFNSCTATILYLSYVVTWFAGWVWLLVRGDENALFAVYFVPLLVIFAAKWGIAALTLAATIPLFVPVAFIVVLAPLLTEDPWRLASEMGGGRIALLSVIAVIPLVVLAVRRVAKSSTRDALAHGFSTVGKDENPHVTAAEIAYKVRASDEKPKKQELEARYLNAFRVPLDDECVDAIAATVKKRLKWRSLRRVFVLVFGIAIVAFVMIYALAVAAMPSHLARDWSKHADIATLGFQIFGNQIDLPVGPYLSVALLFTTLATVGFLAFASTDDKYADAIIRSVVLIPAERLAYMASVHHHLVGHSGCKSSG
ncbi:hypothetical protein [Lentzea sp. NPDC051838]|uniref:hypothetical protein n=1 Tax=Lentzea sp. NPDC051838 TaxID=3154849 RepID=UPI003443CA9B